jgi:hypothetical protein
MTTHSRPTRSGIPRQAPKPPQKQADPRTLFLQTQVFERLKEPYEGSSMEGRTTACPPSRFIDRVQTAWSRVFKEPLPLEELKSLYISLGIRLLHAQRGVLWQEKLSETSISKEGSERELQFLSSERLLVHFTNVEDTVCRALKEDLGVECGELKEQVRQAFFEMRSDLVEDLVNVFLLPFLEGPRKRLQPIQLSSPEDVVKSVELLQTTCALKEQDRLPLDAAIIGLSWQYLRETYKLDDTDVRLPWLVQVVQKTLSALNRDITFALAKQAATACFTHLKERGDTSIEISPAEELLVFLENSLKGVVQSAAMARVSDIHVGHFVVRMLNLPREQVVLSKRDLWELVTHIQTGTRTFNAGRKRRRDIEDEGDSRTSPLRASSD